MVIRVKHVLAAILGIWLFVAYAYPRLVPRTAHADDGTGQGSGSQTDSDDTGSTNTAARPSPEEEEFSLEIPPDRPTWLRLDDEPSIGTLIGYRVRVASYRSANFSETTTPATPSALTRRVLAARDRVIQHEELAGVWHWPEVRAIVAEFGTPRRPLMRALPGKEPKNCLAYVHTGAPYLALCERALARQNDRMLELVLVHEATHLALELLYQRYSGFTGTEHAMLRANCRDVLREQSRATEALAFYNEGHYADSTAADDHDLAMDERLVQVVRGSYGHESSRRSFMREIMEYVATTMRDKVVPVPTVDCGLPIAVRGPYEGKYVLYLDLAQEELNPFFAYGSLPRH